MTWKQINDPVNPAPRDGTPFLAAWSYPDQVGITTGVTVLHFDDTEVHGNPWFDWEDQAYFNATYFTHWMPLPEPPEGEHDA
ncbi:DUF551 domain-containing protein [Ruegeria sp. 2205SS24-7]|uniref:DUF551 domain-containing protein n=1 Tax=Ruegeria discodermiae TaxID=3064389 RepID=UPI002741E1BA|nr:DUF551 domain-containing protein [Ruegeria sp. 2205SS24-7]MDP5216741.1 DUF551 domain-containing protein [Ruegeria sp. 2205SS24-7]